MQLQRHACWHFYTTGSHVWHTRAYDVRQGLPVYQQSVGRSIPSTRNRTTSHHGISSQSNNLLERWHRPIKAALMAKCDSTEWVFHFPWVLLGLGTMPHKGCDTSAAEAVYGQPLVVPGEFLPPAPLDPHAELQAARWAAKRLVPAPITWNNRSQNIYIPSGLPCVCAPGPRTPISVPTIPRAILSHPAWQQSYYDRSQREA